MAHRPPEKKKVSFPQNRRSTSGHLDQPSRCPEGSSWDQNPPLVLVPAVGTSAVLIFRRVLKCYRFERRSPLQIFPPPDLPRNYRPVHRARPPILLLSGVSPVLAEALRTSRGHMIQEEPQQGGRHQLGAGQRGTLLGEDALEGGGSRPLPEGQTSLSGSGTISPLPVPPRSRLGLGAAETRRQGTDAQPPQAPRTAGPAPGERRGLLRPPAGGAGGLERRPVHLGDLPPVREEPEQTGALRAVPDPAEAGRER